MSFDFRLYPRLSRHSRGSSQACGYCSPFYERVMLFTIATASSSSCPIDIITIFIYLRLLSFQVFVCSSFVTTDGLGWVAAISYNINSVRGSNK